MPDPQYTPVDFIFRSKGVIARNVTDQTPPETYLNLDNCEEREENAMSSRYGSVIINRDPNGTLSGQNYFLPNPIVSLSRLKYNANTWRYAADDEGILYRRATDTQGAYTEILSGLSGSPFQAVVNNCYSSGIPYLFIADENKMVKDSGSGTPTQIGINPPRVTANTTPYAPQVLMIDSFAASLGSYTLVNVGAWSSAAIGTLTTAGGTEKINNSFIHYDDCTGGLNTAFNGVLAADENSPAILSLIFDIYGPPNPSQFSAVGIGGALANSTNTFTMNSYTGTVAANTTASVGKTVALDLSQNNQVTDDDLIVFTVKVSDPAAIQEIRIKFDVNASGYTSSYFYKSISPVYYQAGIDATNDPYQTAANQVYARAVGIVQNNPINLQTVNGAQRSFAEKLPIDPGGGGGGGGGGVIGQITPSILSTGQESWITVYSRRGDFLPVGNAGAQNQDWASITGWQIEVITNNIGAIQFWVNGLYLQWGYGPSSFGGTGYDYCYTYFNFSTGTESNNCPFQAFNEQFGYVASLDPLIVLRQAINVAGQYSADPQVTHVRIYRRGGTFGDNFYLLDQFLNVTGTGTFNYKDILPDIVLQQANTLALDNDVPVTATLQSPIYALIAAPTTGPGNSPYSAFTPQLVILQGSPATQTFLPGQIVDIGTPQNLEQVTVITGGIGEFTAIVRLQHAEGEPVQVFSIPAQPCSLVELAYGQMWWAGDPNNPNFLYYSKPGYPENCGPQNYIKVSAPSDPIMAIINWRGTLFAATLTTWYQIVNGNAPYAQPTGSKHGLVASNGWIRTEGAIWYQSIDGIRKFVGADGPYMSLAIEWLYRQVPQSLTPIPLVNTSALSDVTMGFTNNYVFIAYLGQDSSYHRIIYNEIYSRWRNDDVPALTQFFEEDTNTLLYAKAVSGGYAICQDRVNDYDDGGWSGGVLERVPIAMNCEIPYQDLGKPHFPKQWNVLEIDTNTQGQDMTIVLNFDEGIAPVTLGSINTAQREKVQLVINEGFGIQSYRCSPALEMSVEIAPVIYQLNVYAAQLAAYRGSFDTYWMKFGTDESKLIKEAYFDYTSASAITIAVYADGGATPYYTKTLAANPTRSAEPIRVRFSAIKLRQFRCVVTSANAFQFWMSPSVFWKACKVGTGYARAELIT